MLTIAIVGAAGQVGRRLLRTLAVQPDTRVFGITRNPMSAAPLLADGFDIRVGSVADAGRALLDGADVVVNAALEIDRPKRARLRNEALIAGILTHARSALVVHFSSIAVYGSCVDAAFSTFEHPRPDATYGREKLRLERVATSMARRRGQPLIVLRLGHVYGSGQGLSREIFDVLRDRTWGLPFDGALPSNAVHVDRLAHAIPEIAVGAHGQTILNAIDNPVRTWRMLYDMHAEGADKPAADALPSDVSERLRAEHRRMAARSLPGRVARQTRQWARELPLKSLAGVTAVRQAMEATLVALPIGVEEFVDRRYLVFSAAQHLALAQRPAAGEPPPWYYSDAILGPSLPAAADTPERRDAEIARLREWYASWSRPLWRTSLRGTFDV